MDDQSKGPIPPALSPEEWDAGEVFTTAPPPEQLTREYLTGQVSKEWKQRCERGLAALLLNKNPYRFTREDVDRLRQIAVDAEARHDTSMEYEDYRAQEWAESLADRIASLLPPSDEKPQEPPLDLDSVLDPDFTSGLDPVEYLRRFHDGTLGEPPQEKPS